ncbi:MAG: hypothetical protein AABX08_02095 [Nanoarchaeota archaeon]
MADIEILNENPLTLAEAKTLMEKIEKRDKELSEKAKRTNDYLSKVTKKSVQEIASIKKKLEGLDNRLKAKHITKIIDIHPKDLDSLKVVLSGDGVTLKQEDLQKILECLK